MSRPFKFAQSANKQSLLKLLQGTVVACLAWVPLSAQASRVGDFSLLDHTGKFHQMSYYGDHKALVIKVHAGSAEDAASRSAFKALQKQFAQPDAMFFYLHALGTENPRAALEASEPAEGAVPVLIDESQLVAQSLGLSHLGEVIVIDPANMQLLYQGDAKALEQVLTNHISGEAMPASVAASGTAIKFAALQSVSYAQDIVPILQENCVGCHNEGGIAPWAMNSHAMIRGWSPMMREVVMNRRMPPGQIDTHVSKAIADVAGLTIQEQRKLISWIDAGAPLDGDVDPLPEMKFSNTKFSLGEPDLIYTVPAQQIPATGVIDYRYVPVELNLDKDVWVRAMEFVPGDRQVLHHVIAYVSSPADKTMRGRDTGADQGENLAGFAPGRQPDQFYDNSGRLLRKGSNLLLQMHYTTSGRETVDETQVGIYLHSEPPTYVMSGGVAGQRRFFIPAHAKEHKLRGEQEIERDAYLYQMTPHMHFRGKYMNYSVEYPDGSTEMLLSVPKYDFNWQFSYRLVEPVFLPAGSKIVAQGAMDNSDRNPANPAPDKPVLFGLQTKHEMFFGFTTLRYVGDTPASIAQSDNAPAESQEAGGSAGQ